MARNITLGAMLDVIPEGQDVLIISKSVFREMWEENRSSYDGICKIQDAAIDGGEKQSLHFASVFPIINRIVYKVVNEVICGIVIVIDDEEVF